MLQKHANEQFVNLASLETDIFEVGWDFAPKNDTHDTDRYQEWLTAHPDACSDRTPAQCAEIPGLMKQACDALGGSTQ